MKNLWKFLGIYSAFLIQSLVLEKMNILSVSPDIIITLLVVFSVSMSFIQASILGAFAGLLMDVMYGSVFGINTLIYMYLALFISLTVDEKNSNSPLIVSWVSFISIAAMEIILTVLKAMLGYPSSLRAIVSNIFVKGLFAAIFGLFYTLICEYIKKKRIKCRDSVKEEAL